MNSPVGLDDQCCEDAFRSRWTIVQGVVRPDRVVFLSPRTAVSPNLKDLCLLMPEGNPVLHARFPQFMSRQAVILMSSRSGGRVPSTHSFDCAFL